MQIPRPWPIFNWVYFFRDSGNDLNPKIYDQFNLLIFLQKNFSWAQC